MGAMRWCVRVLLALTLVGSADAATYYVAPSASGGNASNSCATAQTIGTPKLTLGGSTGVVPCASAGDTIIMRGGTYVENFRSGNQTTRSGTSGNPITLKNQGGETPIIQPSSSFYCVELASPISWWVVDGVNCDGRNLTGGSQSTGGYSLIGSNITVKNLFIRDVSNNNSTGTAGSIGVLGNPTALLLQNIEVNRTNHVYADGHGMHCVYMQPGSGITIENSKFHDCGGYGIQFNASGGACCASGHVIRNNRVYNNGLGSYDGHSGGGIVFNNTITNSQIYNNLIYGLKSGPAINMYGSYNTNNVAYNNTIVGNASFCAVTGNTGSPGNAVNNIIKNNLCKNNTSGITVYSSATGTVLDKNLLHGGGTYTDSGASTTDGTLITGDPKLVNIGTSDFHLLSGSAAIDVGVTLSGVTTTDFDGTTRSGAWEIGAFNFGTAVTPTPLNLLFTTPPITSQEDVAMPLIKVCVVDVGSQIQTTFANTITMTKASGPGTLTGTTAVAPTLGCASFTTLILDTPGTVTLTAAATGATSVTSAPFVITLTPVIPPTPVAAATNTPRVLRVKQ